jgi:hypothetical protein
MLVCRRLHPRRLGLGDCVRKRTRGYDNGCSRLHVGTSGAHRYADTKGGWTSAIRPDTTPNDPELVGPQLANGANRCVDV